MLPQQAAEKLIGAVILRSQQAVLSLAKEESRIAVKTLRARSFAAAQDDSIGAFFRSLLGIGSRGVQARRSPNVPTRPVSRF
jgi:hypothetical protein